MREIDLNNSDYYCNRKNVERTRQRLTRCKEMGMHECGNLQLGVPNFHSGLWLEMVWSYDNKEFDDYLKWVQTLIDRENNKKNARN